MRIELRLEQDEHEYVIAIDCDRAIDHQWLINIATGTLRDLMDTPTQRSLDADVAPQPQPRG